ncbi:uncharacterized protein [Battus philenor]|uniref:uncharacterized protein n=1 Tax=Battus philenor TaxID=42288 RepID=UPI0035CEA4F1
MLALALLCCLPAALLADPPCEIELHCAECLPEHMPLVRSHRAAGGRVRLAPGEDVVLECRGGNFLAYPLRAALTAACEAGRYRLRHDGTLRHLLELGCQENIFEDVLHQVEHCAPPLQGRAYQLAGAAGAAGARHLAMLCFDPDRGVAARARAAAGAALPIPPHAEPAAPRSLLGNFNHMFDASTRHAAEKLYSDDERMNRRLRELLKHDRYSFAGQALTSAPLLSPLYFDDQDMRVADFVSNRVATWQSVAAGNLRHLQRDVADLLQAAGPRAPIDVYAGTLGVLALRTSSNRTEIFLHHERFPVPKYIWTVVHDRRGGRALAVMVLNDPFVAVSEVREAVFCESACSRVDWVRELRRQRRFESPVYGLAFCCGARELAAAGAALPAPLLAGIAEGSAGLLTDLPTGSEPTAP